MLLLLLTILTMFVGSCAPQSVRVAGKEHLKRNVIFATYEAEELKGAAGGS